MGFDFHVKVDVAEKDQGNHLSFKCIVVFVKSLCLFVWPGNYGLRME